MFWVILIIVVVIIIIVKSSSNSGSTGSSGSPNSTRSNQRPPRHFEAMQQGLNFDRYAERCYRICEEIALRRPFHELEIVQIQVNQTDGENCEVNYYIDEDSLPAGVTFEDSANWGLNVNRVRATGFIISPEWVKKQILVMMNSSLNDLHVNVVEASVSYYGGKASVFCRFNIRYTPN